MSDPQVRFRRVLDKAPKPQRDGQPFAFIDRKHVAKRHELALTLFLICQRNLFGEVYLGLCSDYFWTMPRDSGVLISPVVTTTEIWPDAVRPGDIDLLVIPYEGNTLILDRVLAVEIKAIRASFTKQGKSPNEFGFSQAKSLSALGFPYAGVLHLIVSDQSPEEAWRRMSVVKVLDVHGNVEFLPDILTDVMPMDLMNRAYGRMVQRCDDDTCGLAASYLERWHPGDQNIPSSGNYWMPNCRPAKKNPRVVPQLLENIGDYYVANARSFMVTPRHDP